MRRILFALLLLTCTTTVARAQTAPQIPGLNAAPPGPQPKIQVLNPLFDFGSALEGTMVNHVFKLKNVGQGDLEIRGTKTSCGCTVAAPSKNHLKPGEVSDISVGFDTHFQKGHQTRTITSYTNDPQASSVEMTMQGNVKQQVAASPEEVSFGTVHKGAAVSQEITIDDLMGGKGFKVGPISNSNSSIKVTQEPRKDGKPGAILKVDLLPSMPAGAFDDTIKVVTNRVPLNLNVFGTVTGDLSINPVQVSFGIVPHGQDIVRILTLTNSSNRDVKVLDIASSTPSVVASAEPVKPGKEYRITVTLRRGTPEGQLRGQLAIKTDDPEQAKVDVPFYAIVGQFKI